MPQLHNMLITDSQTTLCVSGPEAVSAASPHFVAGMLSLSFVALSFIIQGDDGAWRDDSNLA